jgi:hypothetical protein
MLKNVVRAVVMSGVIAVLATSTQAVRADGHGDGGDARQGRVKMAFSGSMVPTAIEVQPDTITDEELLAGNGTLGPFTFRKLRTDETSPQFFGSCGSGFGPTVRVVAGAGVFRFEDGSLLTVTLSEGLLCVDFDHRPAAVGHLTETYQITGGTGRFKGASGAFQLTGTLEAVLFSASNAAVLLTNMGELKGTVQVP